MPKPSREPAKLNQAQFEYLAQRADAYILALRQVVYAGDLGVHNRAFMRLDDLGSCWRAARESCASDVPEKNT